MATTTSQKARKKGRNKRPLPRPTLDEDPFPINARSKLTAKLTRQFCKNIRMGLPADVTCDLLGINPTSLWNWITKGKNYLRDHPDAEPLEGEDPNAMERLAAFFYMRFRRAFALYLKERHVKLHRKGNADWYREMAVLERRCRSTWGRKPQEGGDVTEYDADKRFL